MPRGKTKIVRIMDEKVLKSTFRKRKEGLIKKVKELTTLCDIIACVIIYSPVFGNRPLECFTWPEDQDKVLAAVRMYKEKMDHCKRTADLWRGFEISSEQVNMDVSSRECVYGNVGMQAELAMSYLNWVDARIKAVEERIDFVSKSSGMLMFDNALQNVILDDHMNMKMVQPIQNRNFGQEWTEQQNPYGNFAQFNSTYMNLNSETEQFIEPNAITYYHPDQNQHQNTSSLYDDPYLLSMEQKSIINQDQSYHQQQQYDVGWQHLSHIVQAEAQPLISIRMDDMKQQCTYVNHWSGSDAASCNLSGSSSNQFNKATFDDDPDNYLNAEELADEIQPLGNAAGGNISSSKFGS